MKTLLFLIIVIGITVHGEQPQYAGHSIVIHLPMNFGGGNGGYNSGGGNGMIQDVGDTRHSIVIHLPMTRSNMRNNDDDSSGSPSGNSGAGVNKPKEVVEYSIRGGDISRAGAKPQQVVEYSIRGGDISRAGAKLSEDGGNPVVGGGISGDGEGSGNDMTNYDTSKSIENKGFGNSNQNYICGRCTIGIFGNFDSCGNKCVPRIFEKIFQLRGRKPLN